MHGLLHNLAERVETICERLQLRPWRYVPPQARGIDPVAEAEVFLAYGRRKEALRVLQYTVEHEPDNLPAKLLLLQTLAYLRDAKGYHHLARQLQPQLQHLAVWRVIQQEGRELAPCEPLYAA